MKEQGRYISKRLNWPSLIVMVRHGESEGNFYGRVHMAQVARKPTHRYELTERGIRQAEAAGRYVEERFKAEAFDACFVSTYRRTQATFEHMFKSFPAPIIDARLNEIHRGYVSAMTEEEVGRHLAFEKIAYELNGWFHNIPLGGQSCVMIEHVIHAFLSYLREAWSGDRVLIVGHGTWINLCCRILLDLSLEECQARHEREHFKNASITVFKQAADGSLVQTDENIVPWL